MDTKEQIEESLFIGNFLKNCADLAGDEFASSNTKGLKKMLAFIKGAKPQHKLLLMKNLERIKQPPLNACLFLLDHLFTEVDKLGYTGRFVFQRESNAAVINDLMDTCMELLKLLPEKDQEKHFLAVYAAILDHALKGLHWNILEIFINKIGEQQRMLVLNRAVVCPSQQSSYVVAEHGAKLTALEEILFFSSPLSSSRSWKPLEIYTHLLSKSLNTLADESLTTVTPLLMDALSTLSGDVVGLVSQYYAPFLEHSQEKLDKVSELDKKSADKVIEKADQIIHDAYNRYTNKNKKR